MCQNTVVPWVIGIPHSAQWMPDTMTTSSRYLLRCHQLCPAQRRCYYLLNHIPISQEESTVTKSAPDSSTTVPLGQRIVISIFSVMIAGFYKSQWINEFFQPSTLSPKHNILSVPSTLDLADLAPASSRMFGPTLWPSYSACKVRLVGPYGNISKLCVKVDSLAASSSSSWYSLLIICDTAP